MLVQRLRERIPNVHNVAIVEGSTVVGSHVGPGALSITVSPV
jgi:fatty acid-binding protein DegV